MQQRPEVVQERSLRLEAVPAAVPAARAVLGELFEAVPGLEPALAARRPDAELALSELVTNAVLHGREPLVVSLRLTPDRLRAEVCDGSPVSPSFSMLDPTAVTGRGLLLISAVADAWGVEPRPDGKSVWFVLRSSGSGRQDEVDVDTLLAAWGDELLEDPADEVVRVVLTGLSTAVTARSEAHVEALLRELVLLESAQGASAGELRLARRVLQAATVLDPVRSELKRQLSLALAAEQDRVDVELRLPRSDAEAVRDFALAIDEADQLSRSGQLLTQPAERGLSDARRSYLHRVLAQLSV